MSFGLRVTGAALVLAFNIAVTRSQGADEAGIFYLALTVVTVVGVLSQFGLNQSLLRFVAANTAARDWERVKGVFTKGVSVSLASSTITALIVLILSQPVAVRLFGRPDLVAPLRWISPSIIAFNLLMVYASILKGRKRVVEAVLVESIIWPSVAICILLIPLDLTGATHAAFAYTLGTAAAALFGVLAWRAAIPECKSVKGRFPLRDLLRSSRPLFVVDAVTLLTTWFPVLFLGLWSNDLEIAIYSTAARAAFAISLVTHSVNTVAAPRFAELYQNADHEGLRVAVRSTTNLYMLMDIPIVLIFLLFSGAIMGLFGAEFVVGAPVLQILSIGQFLMAVLGPAIILLVMSGHERLSQYCAFAGGATSLLLLVLLVPWFGAIGAAFGTTMGLAVQSAVAVALTWKHLDILTVAGLGARTS